MDVYFPQTAFIGGQRYRQGLQDYGGDVMGLPADARLGGPNGERVGDLAERKLKSAKKTSDKEALKEPKAAPGTPGNVTLEEIPAELRDAIVQSERPKIEDELRVKITDEVRKDKDLLNELREELKGDAEVRTHIEAELRLKVRDEVRGELMNDEAFRKEILEGKPKTEPSAATLDDILTPKPKPKA